MTILDLPGGDRLILHALSAPAGERGAIERVTATGRRVWITHPPRGDAQDAFVTMRIADPDIVAGTFQGLRIRIDPDTGQAIADAFLK